MLKMRWGLTKKEKSAYRAIADPTCPRRAMCLTVELAIFAIFFYTVPMLFGSPIIISILLGDICLLGRTFSVKAFYKSNLHPLISLQYG